MAASFQRIIRFLPRSSRGVALIGEPINAHLDVGKATRAGEDVEVNVFSGTSALDAGSPTGKKEFVDKLLSPLTLNEVGAIRCIGLNYKQHAHETGMDYPKVPTLFMKPATSLADPYPAPTRVPRFSASDDCCDYESELAIVIGKQCKDVPEDKALDYVLGYTAANDVSHRDTQFEQSQWCYSKGFDGSCPIGPALVSARAVSDPAQLHIRGIKNGKVVQDCSCGDLIFSVPKLVSFLSRGTTLEPGTLILTGTPAGVGVGMKPPEYLRAGDEFGVEIMPHIGTLLTRFEDDPKFLSRARV